MSGPCDRAFVSKEEESTLVEHLLCSRIRGRNFTVPFNRLYWFHFTTVETGAWKD